MLMLKGELGGGLRLKLVHNGWLDGSFKVRKKVCELG
jgi:hypothetical protein